MVQETLYQYQSFDYVVYKCIYNVEAKAVTLRDVVAQINRQAFSCRLPLKVAGTFVRVTIPEERERGLSDVLQWCRNNAVAVHWRQEQLMDATYELAVPDNHDVCKMLEQDLSDLLGDLQPPKGGEDRPAPPRARRLVDPIDDEDDSAEFSEILDSSDCDIIEAL